MKKFLFQNPHILTFGVLQIFFSAPGQTFLISLFVTPMFKDLGVSQSLFAGIYSAATLSAAMLLNPSGRLIDRYPVNNVVKTITVCMAIGCMILASAKTTITLFIGFFILRLIGQGVFGLTASTLMIKKFHKNRGKSMGIITLGFPLSEAIYPSIALLLLATVGWRWGYVIFGMTNILLMMPLQLFLLKKANLVHGEYLPGEVMVNPQYLRGNPEERHLAPHKSYALSEVLKDVKFYLILAASCIPPVILTGLLFHQETLFNANGWDIRYAAAGLAVYAFCKAIGSVWIGAVVDRSGPLPPFIVLIAMLGLGTLFAALGGPKVMIYIYFSLLGAALGFSSPVMNVVWPYFYGTEHMGSIKGFIATFRNGLTALGPLPIAMALDSGVSINTILFYLALTILAMMMLPMIVWKLDKMRVGIQYS